MKVFITRKIPGPGITLLKKHFVVKVYPKDEVISRQELLNGVKWCDALLCLITDRIDQEVIKANTQLKVISNYAVGYDNIDVKYATHRKIPVCNTPSQQVSDAVAEHTVTLLLALAKRIHEGDDYVRTHRWKSWDPQLLLGTQVTGKTLGIIGLGRIGSGVAERCSHGMGMKVLYHDVVRYKDFERRYKAKKVSLPYLLRNSDFITLHVPLLKTTKHIIGAKELKLIKPTAYLINTSRGSVVDEIALIKCLRKQQIAGAGLDVYESEPNVDHRLTKLYNVILTPHTASATVEVRTQMSLDAANNIISVLSGKKPEKIVNPEVYDD